MLSALKVLSLLLVFGWSLKSRAVSVSIPSQGGCPECEEEFCPKSEEECPHGRLQDFCGCCPDGVCALAVREKCFSPMYGAKIADSGMNKYGSCGEYMTCTSRTDMNPNNRPESLCACQHTGPVCGSDNSTYDSVCEMESSEVIMKHRGPCVTAPVIISGPEATTYNYEGGAFALDCEAKGFPVPSINWEFRSHTGFISTLPGDDPTIVVHSRGGPENYMITSWLQIESLRMNDSGTYICVARNTEGEDRSLTSIQVSRYSV